MISGNVPRCSPRDEQGDDVAPVGKKPAEAKHQRSRKLICPVLVLALVVTIFLLLSGTALAQSVWYVDKTATMGGNTGTSWTDAFTDLQNALKNPSLVAGDEIWVAAGTYKPTSGSDRAVSFTLVSGVGLYGGFAGTETTRAERDWNTHLTILSGDIDLDGEEDSYHVVLSQSTSGTVLDGFTVTGGQADGSSFSSQRGGGMFSYQSSTTLANVTFSGNSATAGGGGLEVFAGVSSTTLAHVTLSGNSTIAGGGGLEIIGGASPTLTNVTFNANSADNGGGMATQDISPTLTNVTFNGNSADSGGGGMYDGSGSSPTLTNVTFSGNSAAWGGGMYTSGEASATLTNVIFSGNSASTGGGVLIDGSIAVTLTNATFSTNSATTGGGMYSGGCSPTLTNCILWGDSAGEIVRSGSGAPTVTYSIIQGGWSGAGGNNLGSDPQFVDALAGDLHLQSGSPAIDTGTSTGAPAFDLDGVSRPRDGDGSGTAEFDRGAYEYRPSTTVALVSGWNLVAAATGTTTFPGILFGWNGSSYASAAAPASWHGYWCKVAEEQTVEIQTVDGPHTITLTSGWNLIGNSAGVPVSLPTGFVAFIYTGTSYQSATKLGPGQGAWVKATEDGDIVLTP
jgi:predicted outer membrane repeat protein